MSAISPRISSGRLRKPPLRVPPAVAARVRHFESGSLARWSQRYLVSKLGFWQRFEVGMAPLVIGIFFFGSIQPISDDTPRECIGSIRTHVQKRPLVVERERVNFEYQPGLPTGIERERRNFDAAALPFTVPSRLANGQEAGAA